VAYALGNEERKEACMMLSGWEFNGQKAHKRKLAKANVRPDESQR